MVSGMETAGLKVAQWDGTDDAGNKLSPGVYFYNLKAEGVSALRRMILLR